MNRTLRMLSVLLAALFVTVPSTATDHGNPYEGFLPESEVEPAPETLPAWGKKKKDKAAKGEDGEDKEKSEEWDVNNPPGEWRDVAIDATTGTWMSLDVSPDGEEIIFDFLGDLYRLPIAGGEAESMTHSIAWEMQPRFSPDGQRIAFTSDAGGGDNIWIMNRDGSDAKQVSDEGFRLLNSPAWSPDGEYVVARKHFTSSRSLGAGEMWLYHRTGGGGLQLTERPNDQKDSGEPVFSPDGRYVYYSEDTTPGSFFQYNKDPNTGIYSIRRLDLDSGENEIYVTPGGGAVRPTPSPDGKILAFVGRVRETTHLFLKDLASGEEWSIFDALERDMQETWAIHGVYPTMAWTPDSKSIVFWAKGKIWRIDTDSYEVAEIPFHIATTRKVAEALRFPVEVAPETFEAQMLRWVQASPDGSMAVFQALGKLWIQDLPDGTPRRLTSQDDHSEFYPSFSRDGRSIVYVAFDDQQLASVRVVDTDGGNGHVLTSEPGHFSNPVFSPDGQTVVYQKNGSGFIISPLFSQETGIYRVPVAGGESIMITETGYSPQFGAEDDRLFLNRRSGQDRLLVSMDLDGTDVHEHAKSGNASEMKVSPDGRWLAFVERFKVYLTPVIATGKAISVGPKMSAVPAAEVSHDAGEYLHWSGDSSALHWALGSTLYTRPLTDSFAFLEGAPDELPEPPTEGVNLSLTVESDVPDGVVAIVNARVITMKGDEVLENATILIDGNRIQKIGDSGELGVPMGAHVIDGRGKTIIPGLVDVHWHGSFGINEVIPEANWINYASLAFGVTTLHDPSNDTSETFAAAEMQRAGLLTAPRIYSTGTILYGAETPFRAIVESPEDARFHLQRMKQSGAISVKSYNQPRRDQRQQVIKAARDLGMMVVPEGGSLFQHNMTMVIDGHTGIEHSIPVAAIYDDVLQLWGATKVGYTPTLVVGYGGIWGENYWYATTDVWANERLSRFVPREILDARSRRPFTAPEGEWNHFNNARISKELLDAGVKVQLGAHGQREGLGAHWELWMFGQGGMTPMEALRSATLHGAEYLGLDGDIGSIEVGKLADLVILDSNPLDDLRNSTDIDAVVLNGRIYEGERLDEIGNHAEPRAPFFWERDDKGRLLVNPGAP